MGLRLELQSIRIPQPGRILAMSTGRPIDLPNGGATDFGLDAILRDVAVGSDTRIQLGPVRARRQALCPVVIDGSAWKVAKPRTRIGYLRLTFGVRKSNHAVGVGHVKIVANQYDTE